MKRRGPLTAAEKPKRLGESSADANALRDLCSRCWVDIRTNSYSHPSESTARLGWLLRSTAGCSQLFQYGPMAPVFWTYSRYSTRTSFLDNWRLNVGARRLRNRVRRMRRTGQP